MNIGDQFTLNNELFTVVQVDEKFIYFISEQGTEYKETPEALSQMIKEAKEAIEAEKKVKAAAELTHRLNVSISYISLLATLIQRLFIPIKGKKEIDNVLKHAPYLAKPLNGMNDNCREFMKILTEKTGNGYSEACNNSADNALSPKTIMVNGRELEIISPIQLAASVLDISLLLPDEEMAEFVDYIDRYLQQISKDDNLFG